MEQPPETTTEPKASAGRRSSLVVVGTGIQWGGQTTLAARRAIEGADRVFFAVAEGGTVNWLRSVRPDAVSLRYGDGVTSERRRIYRAMVDDVLTELRRTAKVCAVFYGHPGVFATPAHELIRCAKAEGFSARMLPGVSFLDCLYADLAFDPGQEGCAVYEATDFLLRQRPFNAHTPLVLSQIALIGNPRVFDPLAVDSIRRGLAVLGRVLCQRYPGSHEAIVYDASVHPIEPPRMVRLPLSNLAVAPVTEVSTLFVPPIGPAPVDDALRRELSIHENPIQPLHGAGKET